MLRGTPAGSKFQINEVPLGEGNSFGSDITYDDLLLSMGYKQRHYEEIFTQIGKEHYSNHGKSLSSMQTPFYDYVMANGGVQDIGKNSARWRTYGTPMTETRAVFNSMVGVDCPGAGNTLGTIVLDNEHYKPQDILYPINNPNAQILLQSFAEPVSGGFEYTWKTVEGNTYIDAPYFETGRKWSRMGSVTSWLNSMTSGSTDFDIQYTYLEFEVDLTTFQKSYSVDEETHLQEGSIGITYCDIDSDLIMDKLTNRLELEFEMTYRREKELLMMYGRSSDHHRDVNSKQMITTAPGFFEFLEEANVIKYNPKTNNLDMIADLMDGYWFDKVPVGQRNLVLAMNMGVGTKPNIKILTRNNKKRKTINHGYWTPFGHVGMDNPYFKSVGDTRLGDAYEVAYRESFGLAVDNVADVLRLVPEVR